MTFPRGTIGRSRSIPEQPSELFRFENNSLPGILNYKHGGQNYNNTGYDSR